MQNKSELMLRDLIRRIHSELIASESQRSSEGLPPLLRIDEVKLELQFTAKTDVDTRGKADVKLLAIEREQNISSEKIQKVILTLKPTNAQQDDGFVMGRGELPSKINKEQE